jgi:hypothetical protein
MRKRQSTRWRHYVGELRRELVLMREDRPFPPVDHPGFPELAVPVSLTCRPCPIVAAFLKP